MVRRAPPRGLRDQPAHRRTRSRAPPRTSGRPTPTPAARPARSSRCSAPSPARRRGSAGCAGPTRRARATTPIVHDDLLRGVKKINPIATWTDEDVDHYKAIELLPEHPLTERGYASIGCWPCTRPVQDGEDARAGRWSGSGKSECGLHVSTPVPSIRSVGTDRDERRGHQARAAGSCAASIGEELADGSDEFDHDNQVAAQVPRDLPAGRPRRPARAHAAEARPRLLVHGAGVGPRRQAHAPSSGSPSTAWPTSPTARCASRPARACSSTSCTRASCTSSSRGINRALLTTLAACGDVVRNTMGSPWPDERQAVIEPLVADHRGPLPPADRVVLGAVGRRREGVHGGARRRCPAAARRVASARPSRSTATSTCRASSRSAWRGRATTTSTCSPTTSASCRS